MGEGEEKDEPVEEEQNLPALHHRALDVRESVGEDTTDDLIDTVRGAVEGKEGRHSQSQAGRVEEI